jgi:hypothetical protein
MATTTLKTAAKAKQTKKPVRKPKPQPRAARNGHQPKAKRLRCLHCRLALTPQTKQLRSGEVRPTGHFGRYGDDLFCGQACGYQYAVQQAKTKGN